MTNHDTPRRRVLSPPVNAHNARHQTRYAPHRDVIMRTTAHLRARHHTIMLRATIRPTAWLLRHICISQAPHGVEPACCVTHTPHTTNINTGQANLSIDRQLPQHDRLQQWTPATSTSTSRHDPTPCTHAHRRQHASCLSHSCRATPGADCACSRRRPMARPCLPPKACWLPPVHALRLRSMRCLRWSQLARLEH